MATTGGFSLLAERGLDRVGIALRVVDPARKRDLALMMRQ